ncbi:hypothetical protein HPB50_019710 [Hyalomma asiaticum]|uniref:Uncharacterized protein n=1 Tax=Hyalomma asiaticum TaxID=266040 RepID=A0ACB7SCG2_HYAAI|nr:hypothetical protein HPB50_019710 [Hyalomma asiaticum]
MYEVNSYEAAASLMTKGVIRGIALEDNARTVDEKVVNSRNPTVLAAKRLGNTTTVIAAFDCPQVPTLVRYGATLLCSTLYRKQIDVCYQRGRLGHRMDLCPSPYDKQTNRAGRASKRPEEKMGAKRGRGDGAGNPRNHHPLNPRIPRYEIQEAKVKVQIQGQIQGAI